MRLTIDYEMSGDKLPRDYLRGFISLIKASFERANKNLFLTYYVKPRLKPFTFGVYFPELQGNDGIMLKVGTKVRLNFSSNNPELITYIYNSFHNIKEYQLFENKLMLQNVVLHPLKKIHGNEKVFKTISPFLVNYKGESNKYLWPDENGFEEGLIFSIKECAKEFLNKAVDEVSFEPIELKKLSIYHYQKTPTNKGLFKLKADEDVLQMVYDIGIGIHRSQGFGMLEVVR
ncbi:MAG: CRISPR-associated endoribonuclease Cas6 [Ignavibacteriaceae bacterium]